MAHKEIDEISGIETTGHSWDGIKELNNPLPSWWLWTFYACIAFSIGYAIYYPAIPLLTSATEGISGITHRKMIEDELKVVAAEKAGILAKIEATDFADINKDEELFRFASAGGKSLFKVYCSQCHGSGAQGGPGYPNLNDDDWLWGGDIQAIYTTIKHGIRNDTDDDARTSEMPAFGTDELLERDQIQAVADYVLSEAGLDHDSALASKGKAIFAENCADCHGESGKGDIEQGAPNLTDAIWFYGNSHADLVRQITQPRHGVMPAWGERLGEASVKQLAVYIHSLGGGQ